MLDKLLESIVALAQRRLNRPVVVFCFTPENGGFSTRFDGSDGVTMHHIQGAATDLLRMLVEDTDSETTCACCIARRVKVQTALAALTDDPTVTAPALH